MRCSDIYEPLADVLGVDEHDRRLTCDEYYGQYGAGSAFENIVRLAREDLVKEGFLERHAPRGIWRLTPRGVEIARVLDRIFRDIGVPLKQLIERNARKRAVK